MNKILYLILLTSAILSCNNSISKVDEKRIFELEKKARDYQNSNNLEKAKEYYSKVIDIDKSNTSIKYQLIAILMEQDSLSKCLEELEKFSTEQKKSAQFYWLRATLQEKNKKLAEAIDSYKMALELTEEPMFKNKTDLLYPLNNYAILETITGNRKSGLTRIEKALELSWLTTKTKESLIYLRNELEYYQGNGMSEFSPNNNNIITIRTDKPDSLKKVMKENHINIFSIDSTDGKNIYEISIYEKFENGLKTKKTYPNNGYN